MEEECLGSVRFRTLIIGMMIVGIGREGFVDWVVIMLIVKGGRVEEVEDFFFVGECVGGGGSAGEGSHASLPDQLVRVSWRSSGEGLPRSSAARGSDI